MNDTVPQLLIVDDELHVRESLSHWFAEDGYDVVTAESGKRALALLGRRSFDIVITADIPLASRCLKAGARVLGVTGRPFTEDNIGHVLATRDLLKDLRDAGERTSGPPPLKKQDRSLFLQQLDQMIQAIRREQA